MKLARTGIMAAAMLAVATIAFAQKPDFSGTWTPEAPAAGAEGGGGRGGGMGGPMTVKQTADTLTTEMTRGENKIVATYKLDGTPSENKAMMGRGGEVVTKSTAKRDGSKLVISTERPGQDGTPVTTTQTWSMEGGNLVVESVSARGTQKRVYKKTT
jgi:hypothetical protein